MPNGNPNMKFHPLDVRHSPRPTQAHLRAFTLIEMLVVMSIVALLLTIAVPRYFTSVDKSKDTVLQENLRIIRVSLDKFYADKGHYPENLDELVEKKYLRAVPIDPVTESNRNWILIPVPEADQRGISDVKSGAVGTNRDGKLYESM
jgi:general secretion pathway protein G